MKYGYIGLVLGLALFGGDASASEPPPVIATWGSTGSGAGQFWDLNRMTVSPNGTVYAADYTTGRIQYFTSDGQYLGEWQGAGGHCPEFGKPYGLAAAGDGTVYVTGGDTCLLKFSASGEPEEVLGNVQLNATGGLALDGAGSIYAVNQLACGSLWKLDPTGTTLLTVPVPHPRGVAVTHDGIMYVGSFGWPEVPCSANDVVVRRYDASSALTASSPAGGGPDCAMPDAYDLAIDPVGNVVASSVQSGRIAVYSSDLVLLDCWSAGTSIIAVEFDGEGHLFAADSEHNRIIKYAYTPPVSARLETWGQLKAMYR